MKVTKKRLITVLTVMNVLFAICLMTVLWSSTQKKALQIKLEYARNIGVVIPHRQIQQNQTKRNVFPLSQKENVLLRTKHELSPDSLQGELNESMKMEERKHFLRKNESWATAKASETITHLNISSKIRCGPDMTRLIQTDLYKLAPEIFDTVPTTFLPEYKNPCWLDLKGALKCFPYFFVLGVSKCGTTDVWSKISLHPQVAESSKEPHYWRDRHPSTKDFDDYIKRGEHLVRRLHVGYKTAVYGDGSSTTFYDHYSIYRDHRELLEQGMPYTNADIIHAISPKAKFILIVREPVERGYSDYLYRPIGIAQHRKQSPQIFHQLTEEYMQKFQSCQKHFNKTSCLYWKASDTDRSFSLKVGIYSTFLRHWLDVFPREQFFITRINEWQENCPKVLQNLFTFLELDDVDERTLSSMCGGRAKNSNKKAVRKIGEILPETKMLLQDFYAPYNDEMVRIMNDSRYGWV
ncbi:carbohydrate sulfotransferase 15-like isoform X2 [Apostichopus japonicus]